MGRHNRNKNQRKQRQKERRQWRQQCDMELAEEMMRKLLLLAVFVEAAGDLERAMRVGGFDRLDPLEAEAMRDVVPRSRGGRNGSPDAALMWEQMLAEALKPAEVKQYLVRLRSEIEDEERDQALSAGYTW